MAFERSEQVDWVVTCVKSGERLYHSEGAQTVFGLTRARKVAKALGPPWEVRRRGTLDEPAKGQ